GCRCRPAGTWARPAAPRAPLRREPWIRAMAAPSRCRRPGSASGGTDVSSSDNACPILLRFRFLPLHERPRPLPLPSAAGRYLRRHLARFLQLDALLERSARDDRLHERRESEALRLRLLDDPPHGGSVVVLQLPPQGIGKQAFADGGHERIGP